MRLHRLLVEKYLVFCRLNNEIVTYLFRGGNKDITENSLLYSWRPFSKKKYFIFRFNSYGYGIGSVIYRALQCCEYADEMGFEPRFLYSENSDRIMDIDQKWNYYFCQESLEKLLKEKATIYIGAWDNTYSGRRVKERIFTKWFPNHYTALADGEWKEYYARLGLFYHKWMHYNEDYYGRLLKEWDKMSRGSRVLGVMLREDFSLDREKLPEDNCYHKHPYVLSPHETLVYIKNYMESFGCDKIFVATRYNDTIELFQNYFGEDIILYAERKRIAFKDWSEWYIEYTNSKNVKSDSVIPVEDIPSQIFIDNMQKGYFEELIFCSFCRSFSSQLCSGGNIVLIMNGGKFEYYKPVPNKF